uniref:Uncharacterized protein n=1 Tax=Anguilla anguilla TaxID=7936 RepID=A0A0E9VY13_ANGAN
MIGYFLLDISS